MQWFTADGYWLSRLVFQRALAAVYLVAFVSAALQFRALIGERGMLPVPELLRRTPWRAAPGLFRLHYSDRFFAAVAWTGAALSLALLAGVDGYVPLWAAMALWAVPWALYLSIVQVGQVWYGFGWESLLLETGFLAVFLGNGDTAAPVLVLWLLRWLLFRLEFGAGMIKMRGDECWRRLTCLEFHHETQPMPGPLSWFFHHLPKPVHRAEVAANHVTQLVVPFLLFTPQPVASVAAGLMVLTQLWLVLSGNFAWLNWLTIVIALSAIDWTPLAGPAPAQAAPPLWYEVVVITATVLVVALSYRPARNLVSRGQVMNRSFDPLHLVNTYGAFGSISRMRLEVVVEGTDEPVVHEGTRWREYGFRGKPGDPRRLPRQFAPYHLRLDWMMWFAALSPAYARSWFEPFVERLLRGDRDTLRLLRRNPFPDGPPAHIRARVFHYEFTDRDELRTTGRWWRRTYVRDFMRPVARPAPLRPPERH
ncbi:MULTISPECIES: lipase maturation factor family protein [unclassified Streptomyces]|uniref:lipase maturation factor family protein n=1 Tax=unclassified Streptomyces TaxID=2593676 RepID=UPI0001C18AB5|nr:MULTISPECIES: lipase maturation factor family protein [unclassified Streptomyces]MYR67807.1 lipase maturation factor family protein [Streptomyces sp. SID4939]MYR99352.1 lipase maturation factor family protein [Streptomyces sp. SID4940]MYT67850.1 lipase maturation factor family protein [Streptomyces sp. SID8357]MYT86694.1 lipase maturation factor family protein [Streptomyces sp. SID8360]MYW41410.1 lipase maturation factor family protein [Streptomyces sp. SID1]